jgi:hypothetical protein
MEEFMSKMLALVSRLSMRRIIARRLAIVELIGATTTKADN